MNIFISWSGKLSNRVAIIIKETLPDYIQHIKTFVSSEDIRKGGRWNLDIAKQLKESQFGIICLTRDTLNAPWVLFEAGALSKYLDESLVCTLLIGELSPTDISGPLAQFQHTIIKKNDFKKLVNTINAKSGENKLDSKRLDRMFDKMWPTLESEIKKAEKSIPINDTLTFERSDTDLLKEILELSRDNSKILTTFKQSFPKISTHKRIETNNEEKRVICQEIQWKKNRKCPDCGDPIYVGEFDTWEGDSDGGYPRWVDIYICRNCGWERFAR